MPNTRKENDTANVKFCEHLGSIVAQLRTMQAKQQNLTNAASQRDSFTLLDGLVFLFVLLFVYAAVSKLIEYDEFRAQLGKSPLITRYADMFAWFVPVIEILISVVILIPRYQLVGIYAFTSLMYLFTAYITFIITFSPYVPCSCGGILSAMDWTTHLIFNIVFILLGIMSIVLHNRKSKIASDSL